MKNESAFFLNPKVKQNLGYTQQAFAIASGITMRPLKANKGHNKGVGMAIFSIKIGNQ